MDCVEAQGLISAGMDREPVAASSLAEAKEHCRTCPQCSAFVSAQLAARHAPLPQPPSDLADRTMARVRAEAESIAAEKAEAARAAEASAKAAQEAAAAASEIRIPAFATATLAPKPKKQRRLNRAWSPIAIAAAVIFALVGTGAVTVFGMRLITSKGSEADRGAYTFNAEASRTGQTGLVAAPQATDGALAKGPNAVTLRGMVFVRGESSDVNTSTLTNAGTLSSSLGGDSADTRTAYKDSQDDLKIYIADDEGELWEFTALTREYLGDTYVLVSKELTAFGQWPTLPNGIAAPADAEGGTTFSKRGEDSTGARVFVPSVPLTGYGSEVVVPGVSSASDMIALAPRTAGDALAEDPNWTLWLQLP